MKTLEEIKNIITSHKDEVVREYMVSEIGIFGSYVRSEQTEASDLDILVDFDQPLGLFEFVHLKNFLSDIIGVPVDLAMKRSLKPRIGERILEEVSYV